MIESTEELCVVTEEASPGPAAYYPEAPRNRVGWSLTKRPKQRVDRSKNENIIHCSLLSHLP